MAQHTSVRRRRFLQSAAVAGAAGLAGCSNILGGGGGGGSIDYGDELILVSHESGSATHALTQGIATVVNENTDDVQLDVRPSEGPTDNIGQMNRGEAHLGFMNDYVASSVLEGNEPFQDISITPNQLFTVLVAPWIFVTNQSDIETVADIGDGDAVVAGPPGSGTRSLFTRALDIYDVSGYEVRDIPFTEQPSAFSEGRIDVGITNALNYEVEPAWVQEMKSTTELGFVGWPDGGDALREDAIVNISGLDTANLENYRLRDPPSTYPSITELYNQMGRSDIPNDLVTTIMNTMHDNKSALAEQHALLGYHQSDEFWVSAAMENVPFHPAAATFYQDRGVWNDSWSSGGN